MLLSSNITLHALVEGGPALLALPRHRVFDGLQAAQLDQLLENSRYLSASHHGVRLGYWLIQNSNIDGHLPFFLRSRWRLPAPL
ncbi:MAG: hypothetical protein KIT87_26815 [Anaerolineae bacterium]|nr:hypothetical protein [Anaerolineae bacterium]